MLRLVVVVGLVVAGTAGCKRDGGATADTTVPTAPSTSASTTTAVADISTIPAVIDEAYLNRVLAALDEVETQATRLIAANKRVVPPAAVLLKSIYSSDEFTILVDGWNRAMLTDPETQALKADDPGRQTTVKSIISASRECVYVAVSRLFLRTGHTLPDYISLQPLDRTNDPEHHNPTAWMVGSSGVRNDNQQPSNPCVAQ